MALRQRKMWFKTRPSFEQINLNWKSWFKSKNDKSSNDLALTDCNKGCNTCNQLGRLFEMQGTITYGDLRGVAPFPNTVDLVKITGHTLKEVFEFSVKDYDPSALEPFGGFMQVSGDTLQSSI